MIHVPINPNKAIKSSETLMYSPKVKLIILDETLTAINERYSGGHILHVLCIMLTEKVQKVSLFVEDTIIEKCPAGITVSHNTDGIEEQ